MPKDNDDTAKVSTWGPIYIYRSPFEEWDGKARYYVHRQNLKKKGEPYETLPGLLPWYPSEAEANAAIKQWVAAGGEE